MIEYEYIEDMLGTYTLEDIFNLNDLTEVDVLYILVNAGHIQLPNPRPVII